jgi:hypothetical protein
METKSDWTLLSAAKNVQKDTSAFLWDSTHLISAKPAPLERTPTSLV